VEELEEDIPDVVMAQTGTEKKKKKEQVPPTLQTPSTSKLEINQLGNM
jgi:hypothetical protein